MQPMLAAIQGRQAREHPLRFLHTDDLDFILHFVLHSGSLKEMAQIYHVSYPTIRATLDRVIDNLRQSMHGSPPDAVTDLLAGMVERGEIEPGTAKSIRAAHRKVLERMQATEETQP
jgi:hypothetical protein